MTSVQIALAAEVERLRAELGSHPGGVAKVDAVHATPRDESGGQPGYDIPCSCGYDELMKELEESK